MIQLSPLFCLILLFVNFWTIKAQQDPHISLYRYHLNTFNPAAAGSLKVPLLGMTIRSQWQGFDNAPETQIVSFSAPAKGERIGLGLHVINDKTFVERQTQVFGSFSLRLPLNSNWDLFLGLQTGFNNFNVRAAGLEIYSANSINNDPSLLDYSRINPNIGLGAYLKNESFYLSISAPKILTSLRYKNLDGLVTTASDRVHIYASGGASLKLNKQWNFIPSFLFRYINNAPFLNTVNASFSYDQFIDFGVEYNFKSGFGGTLMVDTNKIFSFGYAYVTSLHQTLNQFSRGTHEIILRVKLANQMQSTENQDETTQ